MKKFVLLFLLLLTTFVGAQQQTQTKPLVITVTSNSHSSTLTWSPSPTAGIVGYHIWRSTSNGCCYSQLAAVSASGTGTYTTLFPNTENPISQGGNWLNGQTNGTSWGDVQTTSGFAFGTIQSPGCGDPPPNTNCNDNTASLTGSWAAVQSATGVIRTTTTLSGCCAETEVRLRVTIVPGNIKGYEINCSVSAQGYLQLVRWNGALGDFTHLTGVATSCVNGDTLAAQIDANNVITVMKNGATQFTYHDTSPITGGSPGMSFFSNGGFAVNTFGFSQFTATGGNGLSYTDTTVVSGTTYYYVVTAYSAACPASPTCGDSLNSNQVTAPIP